MTAPYMTDRELFDRIAGHLLAQGRRAELRWAADPICRYRMNHPEHGVLTCAVGCLVPEDRYRPEMEGIPFTNEQLRTVLAAVGALADADPGWDDPRVDLLCNLQGVHDRVEPRLWPEVLRRLSERLEGTGDRWEADRDAYHRAREAAEPQAEADAILQAGD